MSDVVPIRRFRHEIPEASCVTMDTRIQWLWNQRFGTVQSVWEHTTDLQTKTAATVILQALLTNDLNSISLIFKRLEGGALEDDVTLEGVLTI